MEKSQKAKDSKGPFHKIERVSQTGDFVDITYNNEDDYDHENDANSRANASDKGQKPLKKGQKANGPKGPLHKKDKATQTVPKTLEKGKQSLEKGNKSLEKSQKPLERGSRTLEKSAYHKIKTHIIERSRI